MDETNRKLAKEGFLAVENFFDGFRRKLLRGTIGVWQLARNPNIEIKLKEEYAKRAAKMKRTLTLTYIFIHKRE